MSSLQTSTRTSGLGVWPGSGRFFYGWYIVAAAWVSLFVGYGVIFYSYLIFFDSWTKTFGWSRAILSGSYSVGILTVAVTAPLVGKLIDRHGSRAVMLAGTVAFGGGILLLRWIAEPWQLIAAMVLACIGFSSSTIVPVSALLARWFERRRGLAVGITYTGIGAGGLVITPIISLCISAFGWQNATSILAAVILGTLLPVILMVVRSDPYEMGLLPDGAPPEERLSPSALAGPRHETRGRMEGLSLGEAIRTARFWMVVILLFVGLASTAGVFSQVQPFLVDLHYSAGFAAIIIAFEGAVALAAKFLYGYLSDRVPLKGILAFATFGAMAATCLMLAVSALEAPRWLAVVMALTIGMTGTAFTTLIPIVSVLAFGLRHVGTITGALGSASLFGMAAGPAFIGALFVATDSYTIPATLFIVATALIGGMLILGPALRGREPPVPDPDEALF